MKSMYQRQFAVMMGVVFLSFLLLGGSFSVLSFRYTMDEKQGTLERNAGFVADYASAFLNQGLALDNDFFQNYVSSIGLISDSRVVVTETNGQIVYSSELGLQGKVVGQQITQTVEATGTFTGLSNLGGVFSSRCYVVGLPIVVDSQAGEVTVGLVFVCAATGQFMQLWKAMVVMFMLIAIVVILVAFLLSSVTTMYQTKPLKEMAAATRKFAHGEFDARVNAGGRKDEVGELADSFNAMAEALEQSEARRSEFVANISHELKTPMTTIAGFSDGILDGTIPPERQDDALRTISSETRRLSRLVRRMLDVSRLQSEQNVTAQEPFDIVETIARVLVSLETKITAKGLDVNADFPDEAMLVWGDQDAITQVGYNLLDNAIKFSRQNGVLTLGIKAKGAKVYISVADEGDTIPPEELGLVFDRFHKTDHSRSVDRDGVGLGLYIVKTILNNHKEDITVTSENGLTEFTFTLTKA